MSPTRSEHCPRDLAEKLAPSAGLRNRLVHQYDLIDESLVLLGVGDAVSLLPAYVEAIQAYLDRVGDES